jgi:hypothetical protein
VDKDRPARPGEGRSGKVLTQYRKSPETIEKSMISGLFALAAGEGFEPSQTESESGVLPLHNPAILPCALGERKSYYTIFFPFVKGYFKKTQKTASGKPDAVSAYFSR